MLVMTVFLHHVSHLCGFSPHLKPPRKENIRSLTSTKDDKETKQRDNNDVSCEVFETCSQNILMGDKLSETMNHINYFDVLVFRIN